MMGAVSTAIGVTISQLGRLWEGVATIGIIIIVGLGLWKDTKDALVEENEI